MNMHVMTFYVWSIGLLDLKNIDLDTKIFLIGTL